MDEFDPRNKRPTADCAIEIMTGVPGPDGELTPMVIGAGSREDFDKASAEATRFVRSLGTTGINPQKLHDEYVFRAMAEAAGVVPQYNFYARGKREII